MEDLPRVFALAAPIAEESGIRLVVLSVELWADRVYVHLAAVPNELTERALADFESQFAAWAEARHAGGDSDPPAGPGVRLFERCEVDLQDDHGTPYELATHSAGGTGTEWRALWMFRGRPPHGAASMRIGLSRRGESLGRVDLALA